MKRLINIPKEQAEENERIYLETLAKVENLKKQYNQAKNELRCRYCGGEYYTNGYCRACYNRMLEGRSLERKLTGKQRNTKKQKNNLNKIYETTFGENCKLLANDFEAIVKSSKFKNPRTEDVLKRYFLENKTLDEIGKIYNITRERVRQIVHKGIRDTKRLNWRLK